MEAMFSPCTAYIELCMCVRACVHACGQLQTLHHALNACPVALKVRHHDARYNAVLAEIAHFVSNHRSHCVWGKEYHMVFTPMPQTSERSLLCAVSCVHHVKVCQLFLAKENLPVITDI